VGTAEALRRAVGPTAQYEDYRYFDFRDRLRDLVRAGNVKQAYDELVKYRHLVDPADWVRTKRSCLKLIREERAEVRAEERARLKAAVSYE